MEVNSNDFEEFDAKESTEGLPFSQGPAPCSKVKVVKEDEDDFTIVYSKN